MRILVLLCSLLTAGTLSASPLGVAGDFNVFVTGNATLPNTDVQGRIAVGGNATFTSFGIGSGLSPDATRQDLIVGQTLNYQNGQIFAGSGIYGTAGTISGVGVPTPGASLAAGASPINFATEAASLLSLSNLLNALGGTVVSPVFGQLTINANNVGMNVFRVSGLAGLNTIKINVAAGATVIVNVDGAADSMANAGMTIEGDEQKVLFNYSQATSLSLSSFGLRGSLLAPSADFSFNNGFINGNVIVASITGNGQAHNLLFNGYGNEVPEPSTWILVGASLTVLALRRHRLV